jgi:hypothetical protein
MTSNFLDFSMPRSAGRLASVEPGREVWIACDGKDAPSDDLPQGAWKFRVLAKKVEVNPVTGAPRS